MAVRRVKCPSCAHSFVLPAVARKRKGLDTRSDEELMAGYAASRARCMELYGVPWPMSPRAESNPLTCCSDCRSWVWASISGRCYPCYHVHEATRCAYCNQPAAVRDDNGNCQTCVALIAAKSDHWREVAEINARGAA